MKEYSLILRNQWRVKGLNHMKFLKKTDNKRMSYDSQESVAARGSQWHKVWRKIFIVKKWSLILRNQWWTENLNDINFLKKYL